MRACGLRQLGRLEEARGEIAQLLRTKPDFARRGRTLIGWLVKLPELQARVADGFAKPGRVLDRSMATLRRAPRAPSTL